jgi:DNA-binding response OmpR family regulator
LEIAQRTKQNPENAKIPLVALSGRTERELAVKSLEAGAAYLIKRADIQNW